MTERTFNAARLSCSTELDVLVVAFLMDTGEYVLFQQGLTEHAGANAPPYFEYDDARHGGYGLVKSCAAAPAQVIIELTQPLNGITRFVIGLAALEGGYPEVADTLRKIFSGDRQALRVDQQDA